MFVVRLDLHRVRTRLTNHMTVTWISLYLYFLLKNVIMLIDFHYSLHKYAYRLIKAVLRTISY